MFWRVGARLCAGLLAVLASNCSAVDSSVRPRYDSMNQSAEQARNESILLNIVRASQDAPLNFVAFSSISGTTQLGANAGLPTFLLGPLAPLTVATGATNGMATQAVVGPPPTQRAALFNNSTLSGGGVATTQFTVSPLETKDFYSALMRPVDLPTLNFFIRQGYSRELLFWLFTESVEEIVGGKAYEYRYVPVQPDKGCHTIAGRRKCFPDLIATAVGLGLTVETQSVIRLSGAGGGRGNTSASSSRAPTTITDIYGRFCFDRLLQDRHELSLTEAGRAEGEKLKGLMWSARHLPPCRSKWPKVSMEAGSSGNTDTLEFVQPGTPFGDVRYRIVTRSVFGIYQFLGELLERHAAEGLILTDPDDSNLIVVTQGSSEGCFQDAHYLGQTYCIPNDAKNTKRIVQLLAQLVALQTSTQDLAITPLVRVQQ
jgi:hypothetical protein